LWALGSTHRLVPWAVGNPTILTPSRGPTAELSSTNHAPVLHHHLQFQCLMCVCGNSILSLLALSPVTACGPRFPNTVWQECCSCRISKCVYGRYSLLMFSRLTFLLSLLNAISASTKSRLSLFSSWKLVYRMYCCFYA